MIWTPRERVAARTLSSPVSGWRVLATLRWMMRDALLDAAHPALANCAVGHHELDRPAEGEFA